MLTSTHIPSEHYLSSSDYLAVVRDFALSKGISIDTLLKDSELSAEEFINPPKLVNNFIVSRIGINLFNELTNPLSDSVEFGLCMTASSHGSLGIAVQCAANLKEAYVILKTFYNTRINSQDIHMVQEKDHMKVFLENKYEMTLDKNLQRFYDLATHVSIATNTLKAIVSDSLKGHITINVDTPEPDNFPHNCIPGTKFIFNQAKLNMLIPNEWQNAPLSIANPDISKAAVEKCEDEMKLLSSSDLVSKVMAYLQNSDETMPSLKDMAEQFFMSPATFKRKLKEKDTTYRELKESLRLEQAIELMKSENNTFEYISAELGFSDASNFTKAFKNWTGMTPRQYRLTHNKTG